jgi:hypothetical protein
LRIGFRPFLFLPLFTLVRGETVWKLRLGFVTRSYESSERATRAPFWALRATNKRAIAPLQLLSRQSLELDFSHSRRVAHRIG